jgi:hypothetical protein
VAWAKEEGSLTKVVFVGFYLILATFNLFLRAIKI